MDRALPNSMAGGMKIKTSLNSAKELIKTQVLYQMIGEEDEFLDKESPSIYIEGAVGIGKSMAMKQVVREVSNIIGEEMGFIDLRMAGMSGTDIQGIPIPKMVDGKDVLFWIKDALLPGILSSGLKKGLLFLDEINQVEDTSVQSLLYQLLLDKKMNDYVLPEGWIIVSAGNRAEDGGVYNRLPAPIRDRLMIIEIELNKEEWIEWAKKQKAHPAVLTFVETKYNGKEVLHTYDPEMEMDGDEKCENYVFATPRSWIKASTEIKKYERGLVIPNTNIPLYSRKTLSISLGGLLGVELSKAMENFYNNSGSVDVYKYLTMNWVNASPMDDIGNLSREDLTYISTIAEINGTLEQKINVLYLLGYSNINYLLKVLQNSLTYEEIEIFKDHAITNGNSSLIVNGNIGITNKRDDAYEPN